MTHALIAVLPDLRRYAMKLTRNPSDADDLVQDAVERALSRWALFDGRNVRAWALSIMHNHFVNDYRHKKICRAYEAGLKVRQRSSCEPAQEHAAMLGEVLAATRKLPEYDAEILLRGARGESGADLVREMRMPLGTVKSALSRARAKLRRATAWEAA